MTKSDSSFVVRVDDRVTVGPEAMMPVSDRGFLYGDSVFETLVAFGPRILDFDEHIERLHQSAAELYMDVPWPSQQLKFEIEELLGMVKCPKSAVRLIVTRGDGVGLAAGGACNMRRVIICRPADPIPPRFLSEGIGLKRKALPYTIRGAAAKTSSYGRSIAALSEVQKAGFDDVLWSNSEGEITEASTANIFFVGREGDAGEIVTPPANSGLLLGITRNRVMEIIKKTGAEFREAVVYADEIPRFDEAFLCSTVRGLIPVSRIDNHRLHSARATSLFKALEGAFLRTTWERSGVTKVDWGSGGPVH